MVIPYSNRGSSEIFKKDNAVVTFQLLKLSSWLPLRLDWSLRPWLWPSKPSHMTPPYFLTPSLTLPLPSHLSVLSVSPVWPALSRPRPLYLLSLLPEMFFVQQALIVPSKLQEKMSPSLSALCKVLLTSLSHPWLDHAGLCLCVCLTPWSSVIRSSFVCLSLLMWKRVQGSDPVILFPW